MRRIFKKVAKFNNAVAIFYIQQRKLNETF